VVDVALAIVDEQGPEALSLSVVAARAGVAAPWV
jgi:AcrR family transcriptional regulator